ncbi:hypothetical protein [Sphingobacterium sp. SYP-B4668]|uniref:hypothetical protein n=1 Tax=Sphingobacterium sp. SYP-B4668 TaxID=2996035 RepID=UPI0022DDB4D2|nr:hypothetical protein [Sphingobacterium sp. SYP-B4668]
MEQILPLLIGLAIFAYKIYENFNKQKEEDRKRNLKRPKAMPTTPSPVQTTKPYTPPQPPSPPVFKQSERHLVHKKIEPVSNLPKEIPAEVAQARKQRERTKRLHLDEVGLEREMEVSFDLRQAIIQQAILERPYKY